MEYETLVSAANSIAYKNGVPLEVGMLWARQNVAEGSIVITGKKKEQEPQIELLSGIHNKE